LKKSILQVLYFQRESIMFAFKQTKMCSKNTDLHKKKNFYFPGKPPNITLRILSRIEQPFVMYKKQKDGEEVLVGNDRFEVRGRS